MRARSQLVVLRCCLVLPPRAPPPVRRCGVSRLRFVAHLPEKEGNLLPSLTRSRRTAADPFLLFLRLLRLLRCCACCCSSSSSSLLLLLLACCAACLPLSRRPAARVCVCCAVRPCSITGRSVIPKSCSVHRLKENIDLFDFELTAEEIVRVAAVLPGADRRATRVSVCTVLLLCYYCIIIG